MDVVSIAFPDGHIETGDIASRIRWHWGNRGVASYSDVVYYRPLRDPDGIPYCDADGIEPWAEYVATDSAGNSSPWQYEKMPIPDLDLGRWSIEGIEMRTARRAPEHFANTQDHWTQTLRRVWREQGETE
ncbi:MAG: hypothetical protein EYR95_18665 [Phormidium sp. SL48-SHIP]|nr:MAG: hypothetical protein EYR95_18665 [Phormidium sp. SL48-SHIP]